MDARLRRVAKQHSTKKSELFRLCMDVGLPRVDEGLAKMKERGGEKFLAMSAPQLEEARMLYKSAVTDGVGGADHLEGDEFVAAVEKILTGPGAARFRQHEPAFGETIEKRARRFLAVYAQLF